MTTVWLLGDPYEAEDSGDTEIDAASISAQIPAEKRPRVLRTLIERELIEARREEARRVERDSEYEAAERRRKREYRKEREQHREEWEQRHGRPYSAWGAMVVALDELKESVRIETTDELLRTSFALGDGTTTTWGEATIAQHRQRVELLTGNVLGNMHTIALHESAISMIEDVRGSCLADTVKVAA